MKIRSGKAPKKPQGSARPRFSASIQPDGALELMLYGDIVDAATISMLEAWGYSTDGFVSALNVKRALDEGGDYAKIRARINSPGGDAFEGIAIHALLTSQAKPVEVLVDGIAASAASIIAMAGSVRTMGRSAMIMIHDAWTYGMGNSRDFRKLADTLDKIDAAIAESYVSRTGKSASEIRTLMNAETWMTAQECVAGGFATGITPQPDEEAEKQAMAQARQFKSLAKLKHVPDQLRAETSEEEPDGDEPPACKCECSSCEGGDCENCTMQGCSDENCADCPMQEGASAAAAESNLSLYRCKQWEVEHLESRKF